MSAHPYLTHAHRVMALAHRGGAAEAPENSATAFQHAVDLGVSHIETDVRASGDGQAVIAHDATLDRTSNASGPLAALPLAALQREVRLHDGQPPMSLAEALARWPGARLNVDVKEPQAIEPFLRAVAEADAWDRVCGASFSTDRLRRLRALGGPRLATSLGLGEVVALYLGAPTPPGVVAAQVPPRAGVPVVTRAFIRRAHGRGLQVHAWTVDDRDEIEALLDMGVDGIVTDRPTLLLDVLRRRDGAGT